MPDVPRHPSAGTAAETSHLSIGEVLGLLLEEFPDVTISKIRFLESQGLIAPERTPSGYRKFFDDDVELLRVILREQRENYLPLRVIKDRISSGELDPSGENTIPRGIRNVSTAADDRGNEDTQPAGIPRTIGGERGERGDHPERPQRPPTTRTQAVLDTAPIPAIGPNGRTERSGGPAPERPPAPDDDRPGQNDEQAEPANVTDEAPTASADAGADDSTPRPEPGADAPGQPDEPAPDAGDAESIGATEPSRDTPSPAGDDQAVPAPEASGDPNTSPTPARSTTPAEPPATSSHPQLLPGVTLTAEELSAMVGATPEEIKQLEEYGIVGGRDSAGEHVYDDDAVTVARIAVQFLHMGIDARHLRGWKTAADREAGIYEQLITPLLRQRNPQGRQQASEQLQHMNQLGAELRAALMRIALHDLDRG